MPDIVYALSVIAANGVGPALTMYPQVTRRVPALRDIVELSQTTTNNFLRSALLCIFLQQSRQEPKHTRIDIHSTAPRISLPCLHYLDGCQLP